ncbi:MAG: hypothetical protein M1817_000725 [Caeruleum heppii]|nr:MAG: hypothetical protein M1817_000725 [Caeruleum heppii]
MSSDGLHHHLLRPPVIHILRAAGFHTTRPSVLDTLVDLTSRYLMLLASSTASHAATHDPDHDRAEPRLEDVRLAMEDCAVFGPQMSVMEEGWMGEEDLRGLEGFLDWVRGDAHTEIRRIAGLRHGKGDADLGTAAATVGVDPTMAAEDFLSALKKKHSKTSEEARFQGTLLGKDAEDRMAKVEGGPLHQIFDWPGLLRRPSNEPFPFDKKGVEVTTGGEKEGPNTQSTEETVS